jgi:hypothetical protein
MGESITSEGIVASSLLGFLFFSYALCIVVLRLTLMRSWRSVTCAMRDDGIQPLYVYEIDGVSYEGRRVSALDSFPIYRDARKEGLGLLLSRGTLTVRVSVR